MGKLTSSATPLTMGTCFGSTKPSSQGRASIEWWMTKKALRSDTNFKWASSTMLPTLIKK
eukprot:6894933-Alexandrium_andersonii.AAC.1